MARTAMVDEPQHLHPVLIGAVHLHWRMGIGEGSCICAHGPIMGHGGNGLVYA